MRALKISLLLIIFTLLLLQFSQFSLFYNGANRKTRKSHLEPFSFSRRLKYKCLNAAEQALAHVNYAYFSTSLQAKYTALTLMDKIRFLCTSATSKNWGAISSEPPSIETIQNETYTELISKLSPYEKKVANRLLLQWQDNSTKFSNYFVKKIKSQAEDWDALVKSWNTPLELPEHQQPYHYQHDEMGLKLASLLLSHNVRMMYRDIETLHAKHYSQNLNFHFRDCSSKIPLENRTVFHQIHIFLEAQRNESLYYTKLYMLTKLDNTRKKIDLQLNVSFHALNESIHVEKGLYYDTLHPDKQYTIHLKPTEYRAIARKMREIWFEWPRISIKHGEPINFWQRCHACYQYIKSFFLYLSRRWLEVKRAYMRRLLHGFGSIQSKLESMLVYLFA